MSNQPQPNAAKPTHRLYLVTGSGKSANWTEIGAAWPNRDNQGFSLTCTAYPVEGRIVMRAVKERPTEGSDVA